MATTPDALVRTWFEEVWNQGMEATIDRLFASDGIAHGLSADGVPIQGPAAFKPFFHKFRQAFPDIRIEVLRTVTEGDLVTAHCRVTGTHRGGTLGVAATGRPVVLTGMCIVRIRNGQIAEAWNNFDFLALYSQLGLLPNLPA